MATLKEVAEEAGVSLGTASQALSGRGRVSREALERVAKAASDLGYVHRSVTGGPKTINGTIGLHMNIGAGSNPYDAFFYRIVVPITDICSKAGYGIIAVPCDPQPNTFNEFKHTATNRDYSGIILYTIHHGPESALAPLAQGKRPCVLIGDSIESLPCVTIDNRGAEAKGTRYLLGMGHRRIAYLSECRAPSKIPVIDDEQRNLGYADAMTGAGLTPETMYRHDLGETLESIRDGRGPTAIACFDDDMAIGLIGMAEAMGLRVPDDLSVLGFGDHPAPIRAYPGLTTIRQPVEAHAAHAAKLLVERMVSGSMADYNLTLGCRLVPRDTCSSPRSRD